MPTIKDVAKVAGVSTATVSYVLNNTAPISEETRKRVLAAVQQLGYRPSITARNLRASESRILGYAWHELERPDHDAHNYILSSFIHFMATKAETYDYHLMTFTHKPNDTLNVYVNLIETGRVDGFVLSGTNVDDERIKFLLDRKFPFVAFGRANKDWDFPYVDIDGTSGMRQATNHLLEKGHTRIAFIGWPIGSIAGDFRYVGYCEALTNADIDVDPALVVRVEDGTEFGKQAAESLMALPSSQRPTAIVCITDIIAIGVMRAIEDAGLSVGQDIAVTGFDNNPLVEYLRPPLTSVYQPIDKVAECLVEMLLRQLQGEPLGNCTALIEPKLIVRASS